MKPETLHEESQTFYRNSKAGAPTSTETLSPEILVETVKPEIPS